MGYWTRMNYLKRGRKYLCILTDYLTEVQEAECEKKPWINSLLEKMMKLS